MDQPQVPPDALGVVIETRRLRLRSLRDDDLEIRLATLRGLGRMASPQAAEEILAWVGERGLSVPALPLHDERYAIADEYLDVCYRLWEASWEEGAVVKRSIVSADNTVINV